MFTAIQRDSAGEASYRAIVLLAMGTAGLVMAGIVVRAAFGLGHLATLSVTVGPLLLFTVAGLGVDVIRRRRRRSRPGAPAVGS